MQHCTFWGNLMEKIEKQAKQNSTTTQDKPMVISIRAKGLNSGSGFFVKENLIATNIHCVVGTTSVSAKLSATNTDYAIIGIAAFDAKNDLAILAVEGQGIPYPIGDSDLVVKGEIVKAIGCPYGEYMTTDGAFHSTLNNGQWLRIKAKFEEGYSGGPLLNSKGQVIGTNVGSEDYYSRAISANILKELLYQTHKIEPLAQWQEKDPIKAYIYLVHSKTKMKNKDYLGAIEDLNETLQLNPALITAYHNQGAAKTLLAKSKYEKGNFAASQRFCQSAIDDYNNIIRMHKDYTAYNNLADAKLHLAKTEARMGNIQKSQVLLQDALTDINFAIGQNKNNPIEDPDIALCYHTRGEIKEAMDDL
ncbi:hypothetical protein F4225_17035, partial [Candidatus Poribacteria bacterium]|nr:hypothetical protein [Candidatus Poribacteria bacterium]